MLKTPCIWLVTALVATLQQLDDLMGPIEILSAVRGWATDFKKGMVGGRDEKHRTTSTIFYSVVMIVSFSRRGASLYVYIPVFDWLKSRLLIVDDCIPMPHDYVSTYGTWMTMHEL